MVVCLVVQDIFEKNMLIKHFFSILTIYFFIILSNATSEGEVPKSPVSQLKSSLLIYGLFIISTKMNKKYWIPLIIVLGSIYMLYVFKDYNQKIKEDPELIHIKTSTIENVEYILYIITFVLLIVGFVHYLGEKKLEYKNNFSYQDFLLGIPACKKFTPANLKSISFMTSLKAAFMK